ncbi:MAG: 50S ribosomal protein L11 methyltransferase [Chromatiales bacterium]|nr:50S ribosomal protein L11 methyltransferase [Chromatiales bacterium]
MDELATPAAVPSGPASPASWRQVRVEAAREQLPALEAVFELAGALVSWTEGCGDERVLEPGPGETPLWQRLALTALFDPALDPEQLRRAVATVDPAIAASLTATEVADRDWDADWRRTLKPQRFGARLWICPPGHACPDPGSVRVELEPGMAFGTGTHPTTAMCLAWLDGESLAGSRLLDYGCGSGILALAALAIGARQAVGVDIDPQAVTATLANAARNDVADRLAAGLPDSLPAGEPFDVVVANILSGPLARLAPTLRRHAAPGTRLALSGILEEQAGEVIAAYAPWASLERTAVTDGWVLLTGRAR